MDISLLRLGLQQVQAGLYSIAAFASSLVEVPDLYAVALREAHDDGYIVGMAIGFQNAVHGVDSVYLKLVCVSCFF